MEVIGDDLPIVDRKPLCVSVLLTKPIDRSIAGIHTHCDIIVAGEVAVQRLNTDGRVVAAGATSYRDVRLEIFSANPVENVMKTRRASGIGAFAWFLEKNPNFSDNLSPNFLQ